MQNKKILVLYQDWEGWFLKNYNKFEYWFKNLDRAYDRKNDYYILSLSNIKRGIIKKEDNIKIELFKSASYRQIIDFFSFGKRIKQVIREQKPDYIYCPFLYLASLVPKSDKYRIIGFLRDKTPKMIKAGGGIRSIYGDIFYLLDYLALKNIDTLLYNGASLRDYAKKFGFKGKLIFSPRPVSDTEYFEDCKPDEIINKYDLNDKKVILTIARLTKGKNIDLGIKSIKRLPSDYAYLIVGEGNEKENLIEIARKNGVSERVFFAGFVKHENIWSYYKVADIFWLLSKSNFEGTPNVLQESLFAKVPCIVSKIPAMKNIIDDKETGLILKTWQAKELAEKTMDLLENDKLYKQIQENGYRKVIEYTKKNVKVKDLFL